MKNKLYQNKNRGASIAIVILAMFGLIFLVQLMGINVRVSWPVILIIALAFLVWAEKS